MKNIKKRPLITAVSAVVLSASPYAVQAEDSVSFTFAPPPITSPADQVSKLGFNFISLEMDMPATDGSGAIETTEYTLVGMNFLTKNQGLFLSGGLMAGSDDSDVNSITGLNFNVGYEGVSDSGFGASAAVGMNMVYVETDMTGGAFYYYNETTITTVQLSLAIQQRIALGANAGITPYVNVVLNMGGTGTSDTTIITGFPALDGTTSTTVDVEPYTSTQIGFDIDIANFSIAALVQESDNSSITSLNFGFEF